MGQIRDGRKTVATAGTRERLVAVSTPAEWIQIEDLPTNTGATAALAEVVVGGATVVQDAATRRGRAVTPGAVGTAVERRGIFIPGPLDLTDIWLDAGTNGNGVSYIYMEP